MYLPLPLLLLEGSGAAPQGSRSQQLACRWGWPDPLTTAAPQASSPLTSAAAPSCALAAAFSMLLSPFSHCSHTCPRASPPFTHTRYTPRSFVLLARPVAYIAGAPCPCSNLLLHFISAGSAQAPWWAHAPAPSCIGHLPPSPSHCTLITSQIAGLRLLFFPFKNAEIGREAFPATGTPSIASPEPIMPPCNNHSIGQFKPGTGGE